MTVENVEMPSKLDNAMIFSGSLHRELTAEIANYLGLEVSPTKTGQFSNGNLDVQLCKSVRQKDVFIVQPITTSDSLMELLMMLDIARMSGAKSIHAVIPYYSYGRSDKKDAPRISITGRLVADLLATAGAEHIIGMTLHSPQVHGFFNMPAEHLTAESVFIEYFKQQDLTNTVVLSPDIGNAKRAEKLSAALKLPLAIAQKKRTSDTTVEIHNVLGEIEGKRIIIYDDEIANGGTIAEMLRQLKKRKATSFLVACTHGLFLKDAAKKLNKIHEIEAVISTNTVPVPEKQRPDKFKILSVGPIFGEVIRRTSLGQSIGELFAFWDDSSKK